MGARGAKPKPTALKVLHGDRPDRINHAEPIPPENEVTAPEDLSDDARAAWDQLAPGTASPTSATSPRTPTRGTKRTGRWPTPHWATSSRSARCGRKPPRHEMIRARKMPSGSTGSINGSSRLTAPTFVRDRIARSRTRGESYIDYLAGNHLSP